MLPNRRRGDFSRFLDKEFRLYPVAPIILDR